ncbi:MlaD family protein [Nocardia amikacinitolerans]|uniref:MlaD family protein n=1 Tax=Nocardia amikacinitolerans TaxID=756689 RepID=UPI0020A34B44|nr:MlaD family protein [Nocardia amikacinitolerans]MCP2292723.1 ABC-type transporter Mla maintaining outer membrane lipid asymmetry, component MlaD [Nocardia amikacinitolerans]
MPNYGMPGVAIDRKMSIRTGAVLLAAVVCVGAGWRVYDGVGAEDGLRISLHTEQIGDGVVAGTQVRADGVLVGEVAEIAPGQQGTQRITLRLEDSRLDGLDDSLRVDYATGNVFGISELALRAGPGGAPLRPGTVIDLTGTNAAHAYDATMGSLLRSVSRVSNEVLTAQLTSVLAQLAGDIRAFTPLLQSMVVLARTVADAQTLPLSYQLGQFGSALGGAAPFVGATLQVIDQVYRIPVLRTDRERFDATIDTVVERLFPAFEGTMYRAGDEFAEYAAMLTPVLAAAAGMVATPEQSSAELRELLDRMRSAMPETPEGPILNVDIDVRTVPVLAPLLGDAGGQR